MTEPELSDPVWLSFWIEVDDKHWLKVEAANKGTNMSAYLREIIARDRKRIEKRRAKA